MGRRLGKYGRANPKTLTKINKKTILDRIIELLKKYKYKNVHFVAGFKHKQILDILRLNKIKFTYSISKSLKTLDMVTVGFYLKKCEQKKLPVLILHADILFSHKYLENMINSNLKDIIGSKKL